MTETLHYLNAIPLAGLMLIVTLGYSLGRLEWRGITLGPAGGTMGIAHGSASCCPHPTAGWSLTSTPMRRKGSPSM